MYLLFDLFRTLFIFLLIFKLKNLRATIYIERSTIIKFDLNFVYLLRHLLANREDNSSSSKCRSSLDNSRLVQDLSRRLLEACI